MALPARWPLLCSGGYLCNHFNIASVSQKMSQEVTPKNQEAGSHTSEGLQM